MYGKILAMILSLGMVSSMGIVSNAVEEPSTIGTSNTENITGDVNGDGIVNVLDTLALKNHVLEGKTIENYIYDINGDDIVNKVDLIQNKRASFELDTFSYYNDGIYDDFIYYDFDINDNFRGDMITITFKHQYSQINKVWTPEDLGVDNVDYIEDLTSYNKSQEEIEKYLNMPHIVFRQMLFIHLKETGKDKVLEMIDNIYSQSNNDIRNSIKYVGVSSLDEYPKD